MVVLVDGKANGSPGNGNNTAGKATCRVGKGTERPETVRTAPGGTFLESGTGLFRFGNG